MHFLNKSTFVKKMKLTIIVLCSVFIGILVTVRQPELRRVPTPLSLDVGLQEIGLYPDHRPKTSSRADLPLCPETPQDLRSNLQPEERRRALDEDPSILSHVQPGGTWQPRECRAREHVAIIVPYRDREEHLGKFLVHMHQFLQKQPLHYTIFIAEMAQGTVFNTGLMQNVGFQVADRTDNFTCFVLNDVDLLPTNENNLYRCNSNAVVHLATNSSKYGYKTLYRGYIGGAVMFTRRQYYSANGFSNLYFGWGYQDDDFGQRLIEVGIPVHDVPMHIGVYEALSHERDAGNPINNDRLVLKKSSRKRMHVEGLNTLEYTLRKLEHKTLYTWILTEVDRDRIMANNTWL